MKALSGFRAVLILLAGLCTMSAYAQITPSDDSYTLTSSPSTNFGAKNILIVQGPGATTFVKFDLGSLPSGLTSASLAKATLKVYVSAVTDAGTFDVDRVTSAWAEKTITANSAPTIGATIASAVPVTSADKNQYLLVDLTTAVGEWLNGTANNGIALVPDGTVSLSLNSKETTTTSHPAELEVVLNGPAGPPGPQGPPGPISGVTAGAGLTGGGTKGNVTVSMLTSCVSGQTLQWTGATWACANASGLTTVTHDATLTGTGTASTPLALTVPVSLSNANSTATISAVNTGAGFGVRGFAGSGSGIASPVSGVAGDSKSSVGVVGLSSTSTGVLGISATTQGVLGEASTGYPAVQGVNSGAGNGVQGSNPGTSVGTAGVFGLAGTASGFRGIAGVWGDSNNNVGIFGTSTNFAGVLGESGSAQGVYGLAFSPEANGVGVFGQNGAQSLNGQSINFGSGIRGDGGTSGQYAIVGSSDGAPAGFFTSNVSGDFGLWSDIFDNPDGWPFIAINFHNAASCSVDNLGNLNCTGAKHAVVPIDGGARRVALSAIESPKNWFEDFGSAQLAAGSAVVALDPDFTQTVNTAFEYHVFLTPNGDCRGLYIGKRTSSSFEVRELGGGSSSVLFSYRIVALRKNYENIRLEDRTNDPDPRKIMLKRRQHVAPQTN